MKDSTKRRYIEEVYKGKKLLKELAEVGLHESQVDAWNRNWNYLEELDRALDGASPDTKGCRNTLNSTMGSVRRLCGMNQLEIEAAEMELPQDEEQTPQVVDNGQVNLREFEICADCAERKKEHEKLEIAERKKKPTKYIVRALQVAGNELMRGYNYGINIHSAFEHIAVFQEIKKISAALMQLPKEVNRISLDPKQSDEEEEQ